MRGLLALEECQTSHRERFPPRGANFHVWNRKIIVGDKQLVVTEEFIVTDANKIVGNMLCLSKV